MRDMERIKPKYNVTLDNKQIVMIVVSSVVILVLVFVIGFVLGKNIGLKEVRQAALSPEQIKPQNAVVFTQQTTGGSGEITGQSTGQVPAQENALTATTQTTAAGVSPTTAAGKHAELTFYKSLTQEGQQKKEVRKTQAKKTVVKKAVHRQAGKFSIQCGAFKEKSGAERLTSELKKKYKLSAWIAPIAARGEKLYEVRIGHFETRKNAQIYEQKQLAPKGLRNCVITVTQ